MPFISAGDGDLKTAFVSDAWLLDRFVGNTLFTWGLGTSGQIGDNTATSKSNPVQTIAGGINWVQVSCGDSCAAAIKTDGTLWLWGSNNFGRLGDNTNTNRSSPVQTVAFGNNWKQVSCGFGNIAAIKTDGTLWGWGNNTSSQIGDNTLTRRSSPVQTVAFGNNWKQVSSNGAGANFCHTAAIKTDGTLWCWGRNFYAEVGDNTTTWRSSPVQTVAFGTNWKQVSCGGPYTSAIKNDGTLWSWGGNSYGNIGDNTVTSRSSPVQTITYGTNWKQLACGLNHTSAIKTDGTLWSWGDNSSGQLGDNTTISRSSPVQTVAFGTNWKQVTCGNTFTAAIKNDGSLWCWGLGTSGQLGDNTAASKSSPVQTTAYGNNWKQVFIGTTTTNVAAITFGDI